MPIPEHLPFVEPSKCAAYADIMRTRCAACLKYARKRVLPGVARGISLSACRACSAYASAAMCVLYLLGKGIYYACSQRVDIMVAIGTEYLQWNF